MMTPPAYPGMPGKDRLTGQATGMGYVHDVVTSQRRRARVRQSTHRICSTLLIRQGRLYRTGRVWMPYDLRGPSSTVAHGTARHEAIYPRSFKKRGTNSGARRGCCPQNMDLRMIPVFP
jgi:hypothetical protein